MFRSCILLLILCKSSSVYARWFCTTAKPVETAKKMSLVLHLPSRRRRESPSRRFASSSLALYTLSHLTLRDLHLLWLRWKYFAENEGFRSHGSKQLMKNCIRAVCLQSPQVPVDLCLFQELMAFISSNVVPEGFPDSVTPSYVPYMTWRAIKLPTNIGLEKHVVNNGAEPVLSQNAGGSNSNEDASVQGSRIDVEEGKSKKIFDWIGSSNMHLQ